MTSMALKHELEGGTTAAALIPASSNTARGGGGGQTSEDDDSRSSGGGAGTAPTADKNKGKSLDVVPRKPRGRPPGSKNKPKCPVYVDRQDAMRPHILEVASGFDVAECISNFARKRQVGICVMSATGTVCNVSLAPHQSMLPPSVLHGKFEILSLSGMLLNSVPGAQHLVLKISLANAQGQVIGGTVGSGGLIAAGPAPVILMVASFTNHSFHRVPGEDNAADDNAVGSSGGEVVKQATTKQPSTVASSAVTSVSAAGVGHHHHHHHPTASSGSQGCALAIYGAAPPMAACQIPPELFHWPHPDRQHF